MIGFDNGNDKCKKDFKKDEIEEKNEFKDKNKIKD